ncbi:MAG TPA: phosphatase PAP2 family protein [Gemmatimonadales bacterium]|nr:phosphatase PAP2 family protein [Gemmatimonadales bacterium]
MKSPARWRRLGFDVRPVIVAAACFVLANLCDRWVFSHAASPRIYDHDWGRLLRLIGYLWTWVIIAAALVAHDRATRGPGWRGALRRGSLLLAAPVVAGLAAEVAKMLVRRLRPNLTDGLHVFRSWSDRPFATKDLGLPSSHAVVAFAAAAMLSRLLPWGTALWYALASACAVTRVLAQAHFLSDVIAGALVGYLGAALLWTRFGRRSEADRPTK